MERRAPNGLAKAAARSAGASRARRATWATLTLAVAGLIGVGCSGGGAPPAQAVEVAGGPEYPLFDHSLTWTGDEVIIIGGAGGDPNDGELVDDPMAWHPDDGFRPIARPPGPVRNRHAAVWTGDELLIWAGTTKPFGVGDGLVATAAAYDPTTDRWRELAASPPELARVRAHGAVVGRSVVFAGGAAPKAADDARIAVYDLDGDRWTQSALPGPAVAVAGDGDQAYVLWIRRRPGQDGAGPTDELALARIDPQPGQGPPAIVDLGFEPDRPRTGAADLVLVAGRLVVWNGDEGATLHVSGPVVDGRPTGWTRYRYDDMTTRYGIDLGPRVLRAVDDRLAIIGTGSELIWIDPKDGSVERRSIDASQDCALSAASVAADDRLAASGGFCTRVEGDGTETHLWGSFWFEPPSG